MSTQDDNVGTSVCVMYESLKMVKTTAKAWGDYLKPLINPASPDKLEVAMNLGDTKINRLHNNKAAHACERLATAHQTNITPNYSRWFDFTPSKTFGENVSDVTTKWFKACTEIAYEALAKTDFYSVHFQASLDKCCFGTGAFFTGIDNDSKLYFKYIPFDTFVFSENMRGECDTFICEYRMSPNQMAEFFGKDALPKRIAEKLNDPKNRFIESEMVLHAVYPRLSYDVRKTDALNMKFESVYVEMTSKEVLERKGFESMPYSPLRTTKWNDVYGYALGRKCLPAIEALQRIERDTQILSTTKTFPRLAAKAEVLQSLNMKPGAGTPLEDMADIPRTFATEGALMSREDEVRRYEQTIDDVFYANLVNVFGSTPAGMTATEVNARLDDAVISFAPMFLQHTNDLGVCMARLFYVLNASNVYFPAMPEEVAALYSRHQGEMKDAPEPFVEYTSRYAQILKSYTTNGMLKTLDKLRQLCQGLEPMNAALECFDFDYAAKELARAENCPEAFIYTDTQIEENRVQASQARMAMMQMEAQMKQGGGMPQAGNMEGME